MPAQQFGVIYADFPWPYERTSGQGVAEQQYSVMSWPDIDEVADLMRQLLAPRGAIILWVTPPLLMEQADCVRRWGFRYITKAFCWVKTNPQSPDLFFGVGSYTASNSEDAWLLSLPGAVPATHGPIISQVVPTAEAETVVSARGAHSRKPAIVHSRIESRFPGPYLELFARRRRRGWVTLGNAITGNDIRHDLRELLAEPASASEVAAQQRGEILPLWPDA